MFNIQKIKNIDTDYKFSKDFNIGLSIENFGNIQQEFKENGERTKKELEAIHSIVTSLLDSKEEIARAEMRGKQFIDLKKEEDLYVKNKLAILDDIAVLEHTLNSDKNFYELVSNLDRKVVDYIEDIKFKLDNVKAVKSNTEIETQQLKAYTDIYNNFLITIDTIEKDLKLEFNRIRDYIDTLTSFKFEAYEKAFTGWKFK